MDKQSDHPASASGERAGQDTRAVDFAVSLFAAMAHPTRLRMVELLIEREYTVNGMAEALGLLFEPYVNRILPLLLNTSGS